MFCSTFFRNLCILLYSDAFFGLSETENQENQALLARLQDKPENRYANGFFSILQIFGGALGTAGIFVLILQNVSFFLPVILLIAGLTAVVFRLIGKTESLYIRQDRRFAGGVIIWLICCLTGVWLKRKNYLDILHTFRS